jgi:hypothetical protein
VPAGAASITTRLKYLGIRAVCLGESVIQAFLIKEANGEAELLIS